MPIRVWDINSVEEMDLHYLKLDQTVPQTVINGAPIFNTGLTSQGPIIIKAGQKLILDGA